MKITAKIVGDEREVGKHLREEVPVVISEDGETIEMSDENPMGTVTPGDVLALASRLLDAGIIN